MQSMQLKLLFNYATSVKVITYSVNINAVKQTVSSSRKKSLNKLNESSIIMTP
jgi:hypothetical protein